MLRWSRHRHATKILATASFIEASVFPIPTLFLLAPMMLSRPQQLWRLATLTTITSAAGGLFGYFIGYVLFAQVGQPILQFYHLAAEFDTIQQWFAEYGVWLVLLAGVTPIPYKVFTITAGVVAMPLGAFALASLVGRGLQFFLLAGLIRIGGATLTEVLERRLEVIGWGMLLLAGLGVAGMWLL